jgi:hypothetical protein
LSCLAAVVEQPHDVPLAVLPHNPAQRRERTFAAKIKKPKFLRCDLEVAGSSQIVSVLDVFRAPEELVKVVTPLVWRDRQGKWRQLPREYRTG